MDRQPIMNRLKRTVENTVVFTSCFFLGQLAIHAGEQIHNPQVLDVPQDVGFGIGLATAAFSTALFDRLAHRDDQK